ncbi:MAG TPA: hypothetical protein VIL20_04670 [Sandaracinaceae bacterium]
MTSAGWPHPHCGTVIPGSVAIRELEWREEAPDDPAGQVPTR